MSTRDRRNSTPQLALRVAAFGIVAFGVFAVLFLRLWFMQILQGDDYLAKATENPARVVRVAAGRGGIIDRNGNVLVKNEVANVVSLKSDAVPEADRARVSNWGHDIGVHEVKVERRATQLLDQSVSRAVARAAGRSRKARRKARIPTVRQKKAADRQAARELAADKPDDLTLKDASPLLVAKLERVSPILKTSPQRLYQRVVAGIVKVPAGNVPLKRKVSLPVKNYLLERQADFPGLTVTKEYIREYPGKQLAAQIFGAVGQISESQLKQERYRGLVAGQQIGQGGLEQEYDSVLRGKDGEQRVQVDAQNRPTGKVTDVKPKQGRRLRLTLDLGLERVGQFGMQQAIGRKIDDKTKKRAGGAYVALDPRDGSVLAMGSYPSIDPNVFNRDISAQQFKQLTSARNGAPLINRAIQGLYPTGSTFKPITAAAGLTSGVITLDKQQGTGSCIALGDLDQKFCNAGSTDHGDTNLVQALTVSSDTYFYLVGWDLFPLPNQPLQTWAHLFGFGRTSHIDLPGEDAGTVPSSEWRKQRDKDELACREQTKKPSCGLVFKIGDTYKRGDNVNLSVGQGDLLATPLQLAVAYSGLYDPTDRVTGELRFPVPRLGDQVESPQGVLERKLPRPKPRVVKFPVEYKTAILTGLWNVTRDPEGTAYGVFAGWNQSQYPVMGKTGTAERCPKTKPCSDQSWFAAMVPDPTRPIVVVATVENGGFGTETAAPIVCRMLRSFYQQSPSQAACDAKQTGSNPNE